MSQLGTTKPRQPLAKNNSNERKTVAFYIGAQQKGVLIAIAKILAETHSVHLLVRDKDVANLVQGLAPELVDNMVIQDGLVRPIAPKDALEAAKNLEARYGETLSMLSFYDRGVGRGYLINVDSFDSHQRSDLTYEEKLAWVLNNFRTYETFIESSKPDAIISLLNHPYVCLIAGEKILTLNLLPIKFGARKIWSDNQYWTSKAYIESIKRYVSEPQGDEAFDVPKFELESNARHFMAGHRHSRKATIKKLIYLGMNRLKRVFRGTYSSANEKPFGWVYQTLNQWRTYNYVATLGKKPSDLTGYKVVFFPLQMEPEASTQYCSPEFTNSYELISWVSKSLPADTLLVVKEQPFCFGRRSLRYYRIMEQIGNVVLADPDVHSWDWIKTSRAVAVMTGTAGTEAIYFKRPVLSFGFHQIINHLPTVRYASNFRETKEAIHELFNMDADDPRYQTALNALARAQHENSFELPGFEKVFDTNKLEMELGQQAVNGLAQSYPEFGFAQKEHGNVNTSKA